MHEKEAYRYKFSSSCFLAHAIRDMYTTLLAIYVKSTHTYVHAHMTCYSWLPLIIALLFPSTIEPCMLSKPLTTSPISLSMFPQHFPFINFYLSLKILWCCFLDVPHISLAQRASNASYVNDSFKTIIISRSAIH